MTNAHGAFVDLHAHPGRCFLAGLSPTDALSTVLGTESCEESVAEMTAVPVACVGFSSVSDLRVLGLGEGGRLVAVREFSDNEAYLDHRRQIDGIRRTLQRLNVPLVRRAGDIVVAHENSAASVLLGCEGADFVDGHQDRVDEAHELGVRVVTLVHYRNNGVGDLQTEPPQWGGLSDAGVELVRHLNQVGMIVDLAHATWATTRDALRISSSPLTISHSHLTGPGRAHDRLLSNEHARAVADGGGLIGAWPAGVTSKSFDDFVDEVFALVDVVGISQVAIGTDMDGNYQPVMTRYGQFLDLRQQFCDRGLSSDEADLILGTNAVNYIRTVCG